MQSIRTPVGNVSLVAAFVLPWLLRDGSRWLLPSFATEEMWHLPIGIGATAIGAGCLGHWWRSVSPRDDPDYFGRLMTAGAWLIVQLVLHSFDFVLVINR